MLAFKFREGGVYCMRLTYNEPQHTPGKTSVDTDEVEVQFVKLVPYERIEQMATFESDEAAYSGKMRMAWILEPLQNATRVTVRCEDVPAGISAEDHRAGLESTLGNLAAFTEGA